MIDDVTKLPLVELPQEWKNRFEYQVWDECVEEGRQAHAGGLPEDHCTGNMKDPDMRMSWQMGWHQSAEAARERDAVQRITKEDLERWHRHLSQASALISGALSRRRKPRDLVGVLLSHVEKVARELRYVRDERERSGHRDDGDRGPGRGGGGGRGARPRPRRPDPGTVI